MRAAHNGWVATSAVEEATDVYVSDGTQVAKWAASSAPAAAETSTNLRFMARSSRHRRSSTTGAVNSAPRALRQKAIASPEAAVAAIKGAEVETATTPTAIRIRSRPGGRGTALSPTVGGVGWPDIRDSLALPCHSGPVSLSTIDQALLAEAAGKSGMCWLSLPLLSTPRAVWHVWHDGALHVVGGGIEQPLPGLADLDTVEVTVRSKDNSSRIVRVRAAVELLPPEDPRYADAVAALGAARLNAGSQDAAEQWRQSSSVFRLEPVEALERPGAFEPVTHAAAPLTLHRRPRRTPPLT